MTLSHLHAVTGAFGYSGRYITQRLLDAGHAVITLTNSLHLQNPWGERVVAHPFNFDAPDQLAESLRGVSVLYNTYWVRFNYTTFKHSQAVENTLALFDAAKRAGVERIVHTSITNPDEKSHLEYFSGKARLERALIESGISYAILRPTVLFGKEDILINNIAWAMRNLPVFGTFGDGRYRLQPIYVDDFAQLMIEQGARRDNVIINAIGPETFTYRQLAQTIGAIIGARKPVIGVPPEIGYWVGWVIGKIVGYVMITRPEIQGLMSDLLYVDTPPTGATRLTDWARANAATLGVQYASELARRKK
ncbi:MAG: NAD(P)H-binding protein [Chloroflexi bacterium]|nr:NAD(P)H-binding protein [Chloroflexota bacterium]